MGGWVGGWGGPGWGGRASPSLSSPPPLSVWNEIPVYCWQKFPSSHRHLAKGNKTTAFLQWALDESCSAHNRYARMLANHSTSDALEVLTHTHNCLIGNEEASIRVWQSRYAGVRTLGELWSAVNDDDELLLEVVQVLERKFWFVGILEER